VSGEAANSLDGHAEAPPVAFRRVTKRYPGTQEPALRELDLEVPGGEICVLVGPSGSGKTTAMRMVNRMVEITEGDIVVGDRSVKERSPAELRREMGTRARRHVEATADPGAYRARLAAAIHRLAGR